MRKLALVSKGSLSHSVLSTIEKALFDKGLPWIKATSAGYILVCFFKALCSHHKLAQKDTNNKLHKLLPGILDVSYQHVLWSQ